MLLSVALGYWVSPYWFLFTAFVGLNLFQSGFTNMCPAMAIFANWDCRMQEQRDPAGRTPTRWLRGKG